MNQQEPHIYEFSEEESFREEFQERGNARVVISLITGESLEEEPLKEESEERGDSSISKFPILRFKSNYICMFQRRIH